jgi:hypothetical protein
VGERLCLGVDAGEVNGDAALAQERLRGEGQVGVAAAEVDHAQRVVGGGGTELAALDRRGDGLVEQPQELLHLAVLRLSTRLHTSGLVRDAECPERRVVLGEQPWLGAVVAAVGGVGVVRAGRRVDDGLELLGHPELVGLGRGVDVPVAERLVQQGVDGVPRGDTRRVVGGERLRLVVRHHLELAAGLEVDVPELCPAPARPLPLLPAGRDRTHQDLLVQEQTPHPGQRPQQRLAHLTRAAITAIRISPPSAHGITRRR